MPQILYFIGLFPNLQDPKLSYQFPMEEQGGTANGEFVPLYVPPLHGRLTLTSFTRRLVEDMIALFGGLQFHHMDLFRVNCVQLLLGACAGTLETLPPAQWVYVYRVKYQGSGLRLERFC